MELLEVMKELESMGSEQTKKTLRAHGAPEPFFGVKIGDMKSIVKKIKKNHALSLALYETGNSDAQYLAGLIADEDKISREELNRWASEASWHMISEYSVPWLASESRFGFELGKEWILSNEEKIAACGWSCLSSLVAIKPDNQIDIPFIESCLTEIGRNIHQQPNRVKFCMNNFIIAVGSGISELNGKAKETALKIGKISVDMGGTACKLPDAIGYIEKMEGMGKIGVKRKKARC